MAIFEKMSKALNAFLVNEKKPPAEYGYTAAASSSSMPHTPRRRYSSERTIVASIYNRISIDVAGINVRHVKIDENDRYADDIDSALNLCLALEANMDQGPRAFRQDVVMTLFDKGAAAIVPVDISINPKNNKRELLNLRVGEIINWYPYSVRVRLYNEKKGLREDIIIDKKEIAIVENPLYSVMNEPNSTLQRLIRKVNLLDEVDESTSARKLDLIIQLPYAIKSEARRQQAETRRKDIEFQLKTSQYGIAYTDATEKITQINRPVENNLLQQIDGLKEDLYDQLGLTKEVMSGTADEATMINYRNRTLEPILDAVTEAMQRSFLGVSGWKDQERIKYFQDPFKLVPLSDIANIADRFSRNEILSSNEIRGIMGIPPSTDPKAEELHNANMPPAPQDRGSIEDMDNVMNEVFDGLEKDIEKLAGDSNDGS